MSGSESDVDSLTEDLDQIGKLNLNINLNLNLSSYLSTPINLPNFELSRIQEFSKELSNYLGSYVKNNDESIVNSIKTAVSNRVQMANILHDLDVGMSMTAAIDRLQSLRDIINETISLPVEDLSDFEDTHRPASIHADDSEFENDDWTEPVGVRKIVNESAPLISEIVKPEMPKKKRFKKEILAQFTDDSTGTVTASDIEGLTAAEVAALTELSSIEDFAKQDLLRNKIQKIQALSGLPQASKNKLVTQLMMGNYMKYTQGAASSLKKQRLVIEESGDETEKEQEEEIVSHIPPDIPKVVSEEESSSDEVMLTELDTQPTYHDREANILGCQHYQRNCKLECPSCLKWYTCRFCHDACEDHKLVRNEVKHILCMRCSVPQLPNQSYCINCEEELADYFCSICKLYDNDRSKDIYHCDKCGICRLGLGLDKDYFHCDKCGNCLSIDLRDRHKCLSNTTHSNCPICSEYMFTSTHKIVFMKCGHSIHQHCYDELVKHSYKCPMCKKTIVNVETQFRILDQEIAQSPLPPPYNLWRCVISCNDCKGKSNVGYHVLGLKCKYCKSYNTNQIRLMKPEEEEEERENLSAEVDLNTMRLVATNLSSNFRIDEQVEAEDADIEVGEDDEDDEDDEMVDLRKLGNGKTNVSYITQMFQNFINNATK